VNQRYRGRIVDTQEADIELLKFTARIVRTLTGEPPANRDSDIKHCELH
jgi:hypothetical protein